MQILTAREMAAADQHSVDSGIPISQLMENAGAAVARFCLKRFPIKTTEKSPILVLCGKGNNGGDGFVAARHLLNEGVWVKVALLGLRSEAKGDALDALAKLPEIQEITDEVQLRELLDTAALVIDAVVGTGFRPPLRGVAATAQRLLAETKMPVIAIDLPSGWDADSLEEKTESAFRADAVVTFVAPKLAHVFGHLTSGKTFGPVVVAHIGEPQEVVLSATRLTWTGASKAMAEQPRAINGNKGRLGHVLMLGGAWGKAGAPAMASLAALRAGAGLVTAAVPEKILETVAQITPELTLAPLAVSKNGGLSLKLLEEASLAKLLKGISVIGIGPGLGQEEPTPEFVRAFVERVTLPMVIDADALNAIAGRQDLLKRASAMTDRTGKSRTLVLTPHPGEMARLVGMSVPEVEADRVGLARRFASENGVTLVLKGWRTLVAHPDGRVAVNTTGNPSMAKGGSGDILSGIVSALLAQYGDDVSGAVETAVFLHGLAGDFACLAQDEHTVLATDTVDHLWEAFRARAIDEYGFTWVSGTATNGAGR